MMKSKWAVIATLFCAVSAFAYIPPGRFIVKNMASKRAGIRTVRIVSQVVSYDSGKPTGQRFKAVTVYSPVGHVMKSQAFDDKGVELFGVEKRGEQIPLSLLIVYDPNVREIAAALKRAEIPVHFEEGTATPEKDEEATVLRRWDGSVAWVLGLTPGKSDGPQLWVEKDTFLPVRILLDDHDIQFAKYRYAQDLPYPRSTSLINRSGVLQLEENVTDVQVNPSGGIDHVTVSGGYTDAGNASPVKELIRKYYAGLR